MDSCCTNPSHDLKPSSFDQTQAVEDRYGAAAASKEPCLCTPIPFNKKYLEIIPDNVVDKDYGCGDPTRWIQEGDTVLDLGSGSGKNAFICAQIVGNSGAVIGIDRNSQMLELATSALPFVANHLGFSNVSFFQGSIHELDSIQMNGLPLVEDTSVDVVISNCVLNLVNPSDRNNLLSNIRRVLKPKGRVAISDIVSNKVVPLKLQQDPDLWSGCISGSWQEDEFLNDFTSLGFKNVEFAERSEQPWKVIDGIEFRSVTLTANL